VLFDPQPLAPIVLSGVVELVFFLVLFSITLVIFGFLGVLLFGSEATAFATIDQAMITCMEMILVIYLPMQDGLNDFWAKTYYWSYMLIVFFLLLNALLAIIVDSYNSAKALSVKVEQDDVIFTMLSVKSTPQTFYLSDALVRRALVSANVPTDFSLPRRRSRRVTRVAVDSITEETVPLADQHTASFSDKANREASEIARNRRLHDIETTSKLSRACADITKLTPSLKFLK
jgi:hypothetical protein